MHRDGHRIAAEGRLFVTGQGPARCVGGFLQPVGGGGRRRSEAGPGQWRDQARRQDLLTGLPNRVHFGEQLADAVAGSLGVPGSVAVVLIDLDRFKSINNTMGHDFGDLVLASVAARAAEGGRGRPAHRPFRRGRVPGPVPERCGHGPDQRCRHSSTGCGTALSEPFVVEGTEVFLDASMGVALNTFGVDDTAELLSNAEAAMYQAKRPGGSGSETFGESMRIEFLDRMSTEHSLHRALERSELMLHYQPVVELEGVTTVGLEALVRWQHPGQGLVNPYRFIPVAEESGLIIPIGAWVLEEACHQLQDWRRPGQAGPHGSIEVNLSARQIDDPAHRADRRAGPGPHRPSRPSTSPSRSPRAP